MTLDSEPTPLVLLISAPSGGGKTTVCDHLLAALPRLNRAVTCTTRPPREGERNGMDYHFLDPAAFTRRVEAGEFIEHAQVYGHHYGTLRCELFDRLGSGHDVLLNIDVQGAATVRARAAEDPQLRRSLVTVFLSPASIDILDQRLRRRGQDAPEAIERRLQAARCEIGEWPHFDYLVISTTIDEDLRRVRAIYEAEKLRTHRLPASPGIGVRDAY